MRRDTTTSAGAEIFRVDKLSFVALAFAFGCSGSEPVPTSGRAARPIATIRQATAPDLSTVYFRDACTTAERDEMRCQAKIVTDQNGDEIVHAAPTMGLFPADLRSAYGVPATGGNGRLVAIVDGFHYANAEADMN